MLHSVSKQRTPLTSSVFIQLISAKGLDWSSQIDIISLRSSVGDLSRPTSSEDQGGVAYRRIIFTYVRAIARSEQLRDR